MKRFTTPQPFALHPCEEPALTGQALIDKLEDDFRQYRRDCNDGYCKSEPAIVEDFKAKLKTARESL